MSGRRITAEESPELAGMTYEEVSGKMLAHAAFYAALAGISAPDFCDGASEAHDAAVMVTKKATP